MLISSNTNRLSLIANIATNTTATAPLLTRCPIRPPSACPVRARNIAPTPTAAATLVNSGNADLNFKSAPYFAKNPLTKLRFHITLSAIFTQLAHTKPSAPICQTPSSSHATIAKAPNHNAMRPLCVRSSAVLAVAATNASVTPFSARSGM